MRVLAKQVYRSAGFYPITGLYLGGVALGILLAQRHIDMQSAIISFAFMAMVAMLSAAWKEVREVRDQVTQQRSEMLVRIDELTSLLSTFGVAPGQPGNYEQDARDDLRRATNRKVANG